MLAGDTCNGSRAVLERDSELVLARECRVRRDLLVPVKDMNRVLPPLHLDALAEVAIGSRVMVRRQNHHIVLSHDPRDSCLLLEAALASKRDQIVAVNSSSCV